MMNHFSEIDSLLIRSANWVGDAIMSTPAIRAVRQACPKARITLLAKPWVVPVFTNNPHIDRVMIYDVDGRHKGLQGLWRLARDLSKARFDGALLLQNAFEAAFLAWLAHIPRRIGYTTDGRSLLLTERIRGWRALKSGHLVDYYLGLCGHGQQFSASRRLELFLSEGEKASARHILADHGVAPSDLLIGFNPGAAHGTAKRWPAERYIALGRRLLADGGNDARIVIFGSSGEAGLGQTIADAMGPFACNLAGRTTLRQALALIDACRLFITNDSGLMHAAAAVDVPQIALIGPTDPVATAPLSPLSRLIRHRTACDRAPCLLAHCPIDHRCMTAVSVDEVVQAAMEMLTPEAL
jgi:heptosyltransferase II